MNSGWKTVSRALRAARRLPAFECFPQGLHRARLAFPCEGAPQGAQQPLGVLWRPEQVCGFLQTGQLVGGDERYFRSSPPGDDYRFPVLDRALDEAGQARPSIGVTGLDWVRLSRYRGVAVIRP